jgi:hypothetical protein
MQQTSQRFPPESAALLRRQRPYSVLGPVRDSGRLDHDPAKVAPPSIDRQAHWGRIDLVLSYALLTWRSSMRLNSPAGQWWGQALQAAPSQRTASTPQASDWTVLSDGEFLRMFRNAVPATRRRRPTVPLKHPLRYSAHSGLSKQ